MSEKDNYLNQSVINAFKILESFNENNPTFSSKNLSDKLGLNSSSVWRLLYTLEHINYLKKIEGEEKYQLSYKGLKFSKSILNTLNIRKLAYPFLENLAQQTKFNVNLAVLESNTAIIIIRIPSPDVPDNYFHLGRQVPLYCSSLGKILLSYKNEEEREKLIKKMNLKKLTSNTITNKDELIKEIKIIRERGYAIDNSEFINGTKCVALPIYDNSGDVVASLSISNRKVISNQVIKPEKFLDEISAAANKISLAFGYSLYNPCIKN